MKVSVKARFQSPLPRTVGNPGQKLIRQYWEWNNFLNGLSKDDIAYTSFYSFPRFKEKVRIDKIIFDLDCSSDPSKTLTDIRKFKAFNGAFLPVFSGNKGFHAYILIKPSTLNVDEASYYLRKIQKHIINKLKLKYVDNHWVGSPLGTIRVIGTYHSKGNAYCTVIPQKMLSKNFEEIKRYARSKRKDRLNIKIINKKLKDLASDICDVDTNFKPETNNENINKNIQAPSQDLFKKQPCLYYELNREEPAAYARFCATVLMQEKGLSREEAFLFFKDLGWADWNPRKTRFHIKYIYKKKYPFPSCDNRKREGICVGCDRNE